ncbi:TRAP transporter small permease (plasmid) [Polaromonas sp. P1-6]|nr:TRAP transporter small permease [Polaromonas sp. P1-6]
MKKIFNRSMWGLEALMALALAIMVVLVLGNVILRYGFNSGIAASEDITRFLFIWMTFIGAIIGVKEKAHLGMDAVIQLLPRKGKLVFAFISHLLMFATVGLLLVGSWQMMVLNTDVLAMGAVEYPLSWMYAAGFVGSLGIGVFLVINFIRIVSGRMSDNDLVMVQETEGLSDVDRVAADASAGVTPIRKLLTSGVSS